jgi:hypothetical protein
MEEFHVNLVERYLEHQNKLILIALLINGNTTYFYILKYIV